MGTLEKESFTDRSEIQAFLQESRFELDSDWDDYNQLNRALRYGRKEMVKHLLNNGARVKKEPAVFNMCTPLHLAVRLGDPDIVKLLLDKGAAINIKNNNRETPLILAAKMKKDVIIDLLLSADGQQNFSNRENLSHMHIACMRNRVDLVKKFIQQGARINHSVLVQSLVWPGYTPLHFAVQFQCLETVEFLINTGADITSTVGNNLTPLHLADIIRNEEILDLLLAAHKYEISNPVNTEGLSHFHIACTRNNPEIVEYFIKQNVDINIKVLESSLNWSGYRPINFAIDYECTKVVKLLLMHDANVNLSDIVRNPIQYAYKTANKKIVDLLLAKNTLGKENVNVVKSLDLRDDVSRLDFWVGCTPLHLAIKRKCAFTTEIIMRCRDDITTKDARGKTPLHLAFETKQMDIVDLILSVHLAFSENPTDDNGLSHFHISCMRNKLKVIKNFLDNGVDINSSVNSNSVFWPSYTGLHFATEFELNRVVNLLLKRGADVTAKNGIGLTPLDIAITSIDSSKCWRDEVEQPFSIIDAILEHATRSNIANFEDRGFSQLHVACANNNTLAVEQFLYTHPESSINQVVHWDKSDWLGYTPLHFAMHFSSTEVAELLLSKNACISLKNAEGNTPLHTAFGLRFHQREIENTALLYIPENPVGDEGYSHFHVACQIGDVSAVRYFLEHGVDVNQPTKFTGVYEYTGQTALHLAVSNRNVKEELLQLLLSHGANVNARDAELNTPLHLTKHNIGTRAAEILLEQGAEINARNLYDETPLFSICNDCEIPDLEETLDKIQCLLDHDADIDLENDDGERALSVIESWPDHVSGKSRCMAIIMRHIRKLQIIGRRVSLRNFQDYYRLLSIGREDGSYRETEFTKQCREELLRMAELRIDSYTTLKDVLNKRLNDMALHSRNNDFRGIVEAPDFNRCFPNYGFLLRLQFKRGLVRSSLLEEAKGVLRLVCPLPDACLERIFESLSNEDLRNVIGITERRQNVEN